MSYVAIAAITAGSALGQGAMNYFGNQKAAGAQSAANQGALDWQQNMYQVDSRNQLENAAFLQKLLPQFNMTLPDPNKYFGTAPVNSYFDQAKMGLNQSYGRDLTGAQQNAGELAASRGITNTAGLLNRASNNVMSQYAPQFMGLEANRAKALMGGNEALYNALFGQTQYKNQLGNDFFRNQMGIVSQFGNPYSQTVGRLGNGGNYNITPYGG